MIKFIFGLIVAAIIFFLAWLLIVVPFTGIHHEVGRGEHTGYVTAVERGGLIFKTSRVYIKTDTQSSQEDIYCVTNEDVYVDLKNLSEKKAHVTVSYFEWLVSGMASCNGSDQVIYSVKEVQ